MQGTGYSLPLLGMPKGTWKARDLGWSPPWSSRMLADLVVPGAGRPPGKQATRIAKVFFNNKIITFFKRQT